MGMPHPVHLWLYVHSISFCPGNKVLPKRMQLQLLLCLSRCIKLRFSHETSWKEPLCATFPSSMMIISSAALQYCNWLVVISTAFPLQIHSVKVDSEAATYTYVVDGSEIPRPSTVWMVLNPVVNNGKFYQPQLVISGFLNHPTVFPYISYRKTFWKKTSCLAKLNTLKHESTTTRGSQGLDDSISTGISYQMPWGQLAFSRRLLLLPAYQSDEVSRTPRPLVLFIGAWLWL